MPVVRIPRPGGPPQHGHGLNPLSPLRRGLVAAWRVEGAEDVVDLSGNLHYPESYNGAGLSVSPVVGAAHEYVRANSDYTYFGTNSVFNMAELSLFAWVVPRSLHTGEFGQIAGKATDGPGQVDYLIGVRNSNFIYTRNSAGAGLTGTSTVQLNRPYLVGFTRTAALTTNLYVNGVSEVSGFTARQNTGGAFAFGRWGDFSGHYFDGLVACAFLWDRVLGANEARSMYDPATRWDLLARPESYLFAKAAIVGGGGAGRRSPLQGPFAGALSGPLGMAA